MREVVLFPDTFNNFFEPHVAIAAVEVLERAGFRVIIPRHEICCGRPLYDQGMLDLAKLRLRDVIEVLDPFVAVGIPIVGLEPSCILTFRDELPSLFPDDARARLRSRRIHFCSTSSSPAKRLTSCRPSCAGVLSCRVIAIRRLSQGSAMRSRCCRARPAHSWKCSTRDAAGWRAHSATTAIISKYRKQIGERVLIPAIDKAPPDAIIVADGFSCRSQIRHFCPSRTPMHLAEVLNLRVG